MIRGCFRSISGLVCVLCHVTMTPGYNLVLMNIDNTFDMWRQITCRSKFASVYWRLVYFWILMMKFKQLPFFDSENRPNAMSFALFTPFDFLYASPSWSWLFSGARFWSFSVNSHFLQGSEYSLCILSPEERNRRIPIFSSWFLTRSVC